MLPAFKLMKLIIYTSSDFQELLYDITQMYYLRCDHFIIGIFYNKPAQDLPHSIEVWG